MKPIDSEAAHQDLTTRLAELQSQIRELRRRANTDAGLTPLEYERQIQLLLRQRDQAEQELEALEQGGRK